MSDTPLPREYSAEQAKEQPQQKEQPKVIVKKVEGTNPEAPSDEENHDTKDLEQLLKRYNTDSKKVLEDSAKMPADSDATTEVQDSDIEEMRPSEDPTKNATANAFKKVKDDIAAQTRAKQSQTTDISQSVRMALEPMQKLSEKELLKRLDESTKESPVRSYMDKFPNFPLFVVKLIKDKDSIPGLVKILENRDRLVRFAGFMIGTFIFGFILKKVMHREGRSFLKAAFYFLLRSFIMFGIRIYLVYYFFAPELTPAARIFKETLMKDML